jgi:hypothetical protein
MQLGGFADAGDTDLGMPSKDPTALIQKRGRLEPPVVLAMKDIGRMNRRIGPVDRTHLAQVRLIEDQLIVGKTCADSAGHRGIGRIFDDDPVREAVRLGRLEALQRLFEQVEPAARSQDQGDVAAHACPAWRWASRIRNSRFTRISAAIWLDWNPNDPP